MRYQHFHNNLMTTAGRKQQGRGKFTLQKKKKKIKIGKIAINIKFKGAVIISRYLNMNLENT